MKELTVDEFQAQCGTILDQVGPEAIVITRGGQPVATLRPEGPGRGPCADLIGSRKGKLLIRGDIMSTGVEWDGEPELEDADAQS